MRRFAITLALILAGLGCRPETRPMNLVVVTMDTTRADHLSVYGYHKNTTPSLSRLAEGSTVFERCLTVVPITLPSHTSIFTSLYPPSHGVRENANFYVPDKVDTLAELLSGAGFQTAAFVGSFPLSSIFNLDQGFDVYDDRFSYVEEDFNRFQPQNQVYFAERKADKVTREAIDWLEHERSGEPFFLWLHYFDPHHPLNPPPAFQRLFPNSAYDGEIALVDDGIGAVLRTLEDLELDQNTVVIVTADHGEGLGDHGEETHAVLLYDSTIRVPLIIHDPRRNAAQRLGGTVRSIDIMPTALDLLDLQVSPDIHGESLVPLMDDGRSEHRNVYHESLYGALQFGWSPVFALSSAGWKLIEAPTRELYNVAEDPLELDDLVTVQSRRATELGVEVRAVHDRVMSDHPLATGSFDPQVLAKLEALGYVGSGATVGDGTALEQVDHERQNPAEILPRFFAKHSAARALVSEDRFVQALPIINSMIRIDPANPEAWSLKYITELGLRDLPAAIGSARRLAALQPERAAPYLYMAMAYKEQGLIEESLSTIRQAVALDQNDPELLFRFGVVLEEADDPEEAERAYRAALLLDEDHFGSRLNLGDLLALKGHDAEALECYDRVLDVNPLITRALNNRALLLVHRDPAAARAGFERVLEIRPHHPQALLSLAAIELRAGDSSKARRLLQRAAALDDSGAIGDEARRMLEEMDRPATPPDSHSTAPESADAQRPVRD